jgi:hypothetical protein
MNWASAPRPGGKLFSLREWEVAPGQQAKAAKTLQKLEADYFKATGRIRVNQAGHQMNCADCAVNGDVLLLCPLRNLGSFSSDNWFSNSTPPEAPGTLLATPGSNPRWTCRTIRRGDCTRTVMRLEGWRTRPAREARHRTGGMMPRPDDRVYTPSDCPGLTCVWPRVPPEGPGPRGAVGGRTGWVRDLVSRTPARRLADPARPPGTRSSLCSRRFSLDSGGPVRL